MAIAYRDVGAAISDTVPSGADLPYPGIFYSGDLLIAWVYIESSGSGAGSLTTPSGWTQLLTHADSRGYDEYWVIYKIANGTESGSRSLTWAGDRLTACMVAYSGVNASNPIDTYSNTAYTTVNTSVVAAAVTPNESVGMLLYCGAVFSSAVTLGTPSGMTAVVGYSDGAFHAIRLAQLAHSGGSSGSQTALASANSGYKHAVLIALREAILTAPFVTARNRIW